MTKAGLEVSQFDSDRSGSISDELPLPDDQPAHLIEIGRDESIKLSIYGVVLSFLALAAGSALVGAGDGSIGLPWLLLLAAIVTIVVHELVHGLFFKVFGGAPTFGLGITHFLPYAYATSAGDRFSPRQMTVIGAAPLFVVTAAAAGLGLAIPQMAPYAILAIVINVGGAIGDLWMIREMWRFHDVDDVTFEDRNDGLAVHSPDPRAAAISSSIRRSADKESGFAVNFLGAAIGFAVVAFVISMALAGFGSEEALRIGPSWFALIDYAPASDGFEIGVNFLPAILAGALVAAVKHARNTRKEGVN